MNSRFFKLLISFVLALFFVLSPGHNLPAKAAGASLYLAPSTGTHVINSTFTVSIRANTDGQVINAAEGAISYDTALLDVAGISKNGSIFTLWTADPSAGSGGNISFGGGIPNPGYNGTAGHIFSVTFRAKKAGTAQVRFTSGAVLANDGKGTNILASMGSGSYTLAPRVEAPTQKPAEPAEPAEPEYNKPNIKSLTHPDQAVWYNVNDVKFVWELPSGVNGVSLGLDQDVYSDPGPISDGLLSEKEYQGVEDGISYFHLKYKDSRKWGTIAHYKVMIDTQPPKAFEIKVKEAEQGDLPEFHFKAEDDLSGIKHYEIIIGDLNNEAQIIEPDKEFYKPSELGAGEHSVLIKAVDNAGNSAYAQTTFVVASIEAPVITNYSEEISPNDKFFINGTALPNVVINIFVELEQATVLSGSAQSDNNGNWFYVSPEGLDNGRYIAWAEAINGKGIKSGSSNKISFLVTPPVFTRIGSFVINYFTVLVSLLFLILLIIALVVFIVWLVRRKLKKETGEVEEILKANAEEMKKSINNEFAELDKQATIAAIKKEKENIKNRLVNKVGENTKKTLKEIKDVEELLK